MSNKRIVLQLPYRIAGCYVLFCIPAFVSLAIGDLFAPWSMLAPIASVAIGAWFITRAVQPLAEVESQLSQAAAAHVLKDIELRHVREYGALTRGFNRLVDSHQTQREQGSLETRLHNALIKQGNHQTSDILHSLSDGVAVSNELGVIEFANYALAALLGGETSADELRGASFADLLPPSDDPSWKTQFDWQTREHLDVTGEFEKKTPVGKRVLRLVRRPLVDGSGGKNAQQRFVWTVRDITQQQLAEEMKRQFLDAATHELRTPLANMKAYAETLALSEVIDIEQQKEFLNIINSEASRLARFVDELLDLSSIEMGALAVERQKVEWDRLFGEVIGKAKPLMEQKNIDFQTDFPPKLPELSVDKDKFVTTLVNLLGNAAKYTPEGGRVTWKVRYEEDRLVLEVEDTGVGMAPEELPKIFDKFFRSSDQRVRQQAGTGLGLSLAQEVIRLHGGEITVQSELNQGSTFTVTLPLETAV